MKRKLLLVLVFFGLVAGPQALSAQQAQHGRFISPKKPSLDAEAPNSFKTRYIPMKMRGGTTLTLITPEYWKPVAMKLSRSLEQSHAFFSSLFGEIPEFQSSVRLMDEDEFYRETGAPSWTNAMYYRNQIIIPLNRKEALDFENLFRSVRHEYSHAVIHSLSGGNAPGWLDEGIAQWSEGSENPALQPALYRWLEANEPLPLMMLQGGFTRLESEMVPAAYAQSLFAANTMINTYGFKHIRKFFDRLRGGEGKSRAFHKNFKLSESAFESRLGKTLSNWKEKHKDRHD